MDKLLKLVKHFEGCKLTSYQDTGGVWTIGYGETAGVTRGMKISQEIADVLLKSRLTGLLEVVQTLTNNELNQNAEYAVTSLVYNIGVGAFERSTLLKLILKSVDTTPTESPEMCDLITKEIKRWNKDNGKVLPGLVRRRAAEVTLFMTGALVLDPS